MAPDFPTFFSAAFADGRQPYGYQKRLACGEKSQGESDEAWLCHGTACISRLISIPTGLGKTAAVVLAWLWNRQGEVASASAESGPQALWPRRLVYCLPMRTLVEQTASEAQNWVDRLHEKKLITGKKPRVVILMGGEVLEGDAKDWDIYPEEDAILIGTQDMLLSRALNRGYGMSRYRWPMHFGLLNNDCLWVLDETQLMGSALWTTAQLDWMRQDRFPSFKRCVSWWMSATLGTQFFDTLDRTHAGMVAPTPLSLSPQEETDIVALKAIRPVQSYEVKSPAKKKAKGKSADASPTDWLIQQLADSIVQEHQLGHLTLVVCNRVRYAQDIKAAIQSRSQNQNTEVLLLTSRFRPRDRQETLCKVIAFEKARKAGKSHAGMILVSTQVIEAGFDISAARLWTEAAPWPSFLQRLGRLNRDAKLNDLPANAQAFVFQVPPEKKGDIGPYDPADLKLGADIVSKLIAVCAQAPSTPIRQLLAQLGAQPETGKLIQRALEPKQEPFPRAMDVHGLFSTEPDVFGGFTDISPWVRNSDPNADVSVFWRNFKATDRDANAGDGPGLQADELCSVPVHRLRDLLGTTRRAWTWEPKRKCWETLRTADLRPGMTIMLPATHGGYDVSLGWTGEPSTKLADVPSPGPFEDGDDEDVESQIGQWVKLDTHLADTRDVAAQISRSLELSLELETCIVQSAELHDIGKSLRRWQAKLPTPHPAASELFAKAPYELKLDLSQAPDALAQCLALIEVESKQEVLHVKHCANTNQACLQLRLRLKRALIAQLEVILTVRPKLSAFHPGCRHEAASALAMWQRYYRSGAPRTFPALAIYIVAAHHGKVRTALNSSTYVNVENVSGIPKDDSEVLAWNPEWKLDFEAATDGAAGDFSDDGNTFTFAAPGWSGLVADLLGGWEKDATKLTCGAVPANEPHALGPFVLAYFEALLRAADGRSSANPSTTATHPSP